MPSILSEGHWQHVARGDEIGQGGDLPQKPKVWGVAWSNRGCLNWRREQLGDSTAVHVGRVLMGRKGTRLALWHDQRQDRDQWRRRAADFSLTSVSTFQAPVIRMWNELPVEVVTSTSLHLLEPGVCVPWPVCQRGAENLLRHWTGYHLGALPIPQYVDFPYLS